MAQATAPAVVKDYVSSPIELLKISIEAIKVNLGTAVALAGATIGAALVLGLLLFGLASRGSAMVLLLIVLVPLAILGLAMSIGTIFAVIMLASARHQKLTFQQAWAYVGSHGTRILGVNVLVALAIFGGMILFIIPGLIFAAWFSLAPYAVLEEDKGVLDAMKRSRELVQGHVIEMWGLFGLTSAASVILSIVPILGPIASLVLGVMYAPATAIRYLQLKKLKDSNTPAPPIDVWNYIVIVVLILGGAFVRPLANTYYPGLPNSRL